MSYKSPGLSPPISLSDSSHGIIFRAAVYVSCIARQFAALLAGRVSDDRRQGGTGYKQLRGERQTQDELDTLGTHTGVYYQHRKQNTGCIVCARHFARGDIHRPVSSQPKEKLSCLHSALHKPMPSSYVFHNKKINDLFIAVG